MRTDNNPVNYVVSLGTHCYSSWLLNRMGLRQYSCPFDWVFSNPKMIAHCIQDEFRTFLDKTCYYDSDGSGHCGHEFYSKNFDLPKIFNHHDPRVEKDYCYFQRSVERFQEVLSASGSKLFLCVTSANIAPDHLIEEMGSALLEKTNDANECKILAVIGASELAPVTAMKELRKVGGVEVYDMTPSSKMINGLSFEVEADNLAIAKLVQAFDVNLKNIAVQHCGAGA